MKSTQTPIALTLLLLISTLPSVVFAQSGRNGGSGVENSDGSISLMDTLDGMSHDARCDWTYTMADLMKQSPEAQSALKKLSQIHAYAAVALQTEAERIAVCLGGSFDQKVDEEIRRSVNPYEEEENRREEILYARERLREIYSSFRLTPREKEELPALEALAEEPLPNVPPRIFRRFDRRLKVIALRWDNKVFIDQTRLKRLSKDDVAFLYIHEISHSLVPENDFGGRMAARADGARPIAYSPEDEAKGFNTRYDRLWSFVNSIYRNYKVGLSHEGFANSIRLNGAKLPETDDFWKKTPTEYSIALDRASSIEPKRRIMAISKLDWRDVQENLLAGDIQEIYSFLDIWYEPAIRIMNDLQFSWEDELKKQMSTLGLDPFQTLSGNRSLITIAAESLNQNAVNVLLTYPIQSKDPQVRARFFDALVKQKVTLIDPTILVTQFDPNEGEYIRVLEEGVQKYIGQISFFARAIQGGNLEIARIFLNSGKVSLKTIADGFRSLMSTDMGISNLHLSGRQEDRRALMNDLLRVQGFTPNRGDLLAALKAQNEYATHVLLDSVVPYAPELIEFVKSSWGKDYTRRPILEKMIARSGDAINSKDENGITVLEHAVSVLNLEVARLILKSGRVSPDIISQAIRSLVAQDMGNEINVPSLNQQNRRSLFDEMFSASTAKPTREDLLAALRAKNQYAATRLIQTVRPSIIELQQLVNSPWGNELAQRELLTKAIETAGADVLNARDQDGFTLVDYAIRDGIRTGDPTRFLILVKNGANSFKNTVSNEPGDHRDEKEWIMTQLIHTNSGTAITHYLHAIQNEPFPALWLEITCLHRAKSMGKANAAAAIQAFIDQRH